jgi:negative regulator of genetic competence, sporulation and motility
MPSDQASKISKLDLQLKIILALASISLLIVVATVAFLLVILYRNYRRNSNLCRQQSSKTTSENLERGQTSEEDDDDEKASKTGSHDTDSGTLVNSQSKEATKQQPRISIVINYATPRGVVSTVPGFPAGHERASDRFPGTSISRNGGTCIPRFRLNHSDREDDEEEEKEETTEIDDDETDQDEDGDEHNRQCTYAFAVSRGSTPTNFYSEGSTPSEWSQSQAAEAGLAEKYAEALEEAVRLGIPTSEPGFKFYRYKVVDVWRKG